MAERCLGHAIRGVEGVYDRHDYFKERRAALEQWGGLLIEAEQGGSKIVSIRRGQDPCCHSESRSHLSRYPEYGSHVVQFEVAEARNSGIQLSGRKSVTCVLDTPVHREPVKAHKRGQRDVTGLRLPATGIEYSAIPDEPVSR